MPSAQPLQGAPTVQRDWTTWRLSRNRFGMAGLGSLRGDTAAAQARVAFPRRLLMRRLLPNLIAVAWLFLALPATWAAAQGTTVTHEGMAVQVNQPSGWTAAAGSERAIFNFVHEDSQSRMEVIGVELITSDVADVFFSTFHDALRDADFRAGESEGQVYGANAGLETRYTFQYAGVSLTVRVFEFVRRDVAWIFVSYAESSFDDELMPLFRELVASFAHMDR